ncbi:hypothetical protein GUJ93_ZPchr0005g16284 [Zizania palustris]|uniref:Uncharacterized protein n=1 Tax=Zizania palustris TaxID=103762 RepID=A0A8J5SCC6_ZIZPA|nr:hypothetical protein GUJ93_ZPchr0005g16284 [Zizania palustris]
MAGRRGRSAWRLRQRAREERAATWAEGAGGARGGRQGRSVRRLRQRAREERVVVRAEGAGGGAVAHRQGELEATWRR